MAAAVVGRIGTKSSSQDDVSLLYGANPNFKTSAVQCLKAVERLGPVSSSMAVAVEHTVLNAVLATVHTVPATLLA